MVLLPAFGLRVQNHEVRIVIQPSKNLPNLGEFTHLLWGQIVMLRQNLEELSNSSLYQKE